MKRTLLSAIALAFAVTGASSYPLFTNSAGLVQYQSFNAHSYTLQPWFGTNIAVLVPTNPPRNAVVMSNIVRALDLAYDYYRRATGRVPTFWDATTLYGRDTIAVVTNTCGAGCGYLGFNGIEILESYFDPVYNDVAAHNQYAHFPFYELGRNFWFYGNQLAYKSPDSDPVVTGFAIYMQFASMDAAGVVGSSFRGASASTLRATGTNLMDHYIGTTSMNWSNTFRLAQAPANPLNLGGSDLVASLLMRLGRDFGGPGFGTNFWRQVALRPVASTTQTAVDNFILAACATVNQNLTHIFTNKWKFPMSGLAMQEAQSRWGTPVHYRPSLVLTTGGDSALRFSWQTQTNTTYQLQASTNLQDWVDFGLPRLGNAGVVAVTNLSAAIPHQYFRLNSTEITFTNPVITNLAGVFVPPNADAWYYRKGTNEASNPVSAWRFPGFVQDATWIPARTSVGYSDNDDNTILTDMQNRYSSVFLRRFFSVAPGEMPAALRIKARVDDGCIVWINGTEVARFHVDAGLSPAYNSFAQIHEADPVLFEVKDVLNAGAFLVEGTNVVAVQVFNNILNSGDLTIDVAVEILPD